MEYRTVGRPGHGRRSKLDIVGDILRVISEGAEKPTNIMFKANLTWPLTLAYIETLMRHDMLRAEAVGSKLAYHVTPKGNALLRSFMETEEAAAELELDKLDSALLSKAGKAKPKEEMPMSLEAIRLVNEKEGYRVLPSTRKGLSGVDHSFDLVMANDHGTKLGYIVSAKGVVGDVIRAFILQTDCEMQVQVLSLSRPEDQARALAMSYSISIIPVRGERNV